MPELNPNLEKGRRYMNIVESGKFDEFAELFAPDAVVEQLPNRMFRSTISLPISYLWLENSYRPDSSGVLWTGTLAVSFGNLQKGSDMRCTLGDVPRD
jgi:hypothetical protein